MSIIKTQKPFSINEWKRGAKIETRDGHQVRLLCTDAKSDLGSIIGLVDYSDDERLFTWFADGRYWLEGINSSKSLVIVEEREEPERWADDKEAMGTGYYIDALSVVSPGRCYLNDPHNMRFFASDKLAKSARAMARISQLMVNDRRYGGVVTDKEWLDSNSIKFILLRYEGKIDKDVRSVTYHFLAFHTKEQRELFLEEHERLVKDFLMID